MGSSPRHVGLAGLGAAQGAKGEPGLVLMKGSDNKQQVSKSGGQLFLTLWPSWR